MCCIFSVVLGVGPRMGVLLWWLFDHVFVRDAFPHLFWLIVGILFAPWTALFYLVGFATGSGIGGWDYLWIGIGILLDLTSYSGGAWGNRKRLAKYGD